MDLFYIPGSWYKVARRQSTCMSTNFVTLRYSSHVSCRGVVRRFSWTSNCFCVTLRRTAMQVSAGRFSRLGGVLSGNTTWCLPGQTMLVTSSSRSMGYEEALIYYLGGPSDGLQGYALIESMVLLRKIGNMSHRGPTVIRRLIVNRKAS